MRLRFAILALALCAVSPARAQDMPPAPHSAPYDDTIIKARLGAFIGTMFLVMPGELRGALLAADGDLVRASPDLDLITARYQAMTEKMAVDLAGEARNAARSDPSRFAADASAIAATTDVLRGHPGWMLAMVGAGAFEREKDRPESIAALAFGRRMTALTAELRSASDPGEAQSVLQRQRGETDVFAEEISSILRANIEAGPDQASQIAALPMATDLVRAIPDSIRDQLSAPAPPAGSALALMSSAQSEMLLEQLKEIFTGMVQAITDNRADPEAADAALDALIAGRQPGIAALADRTLAVSDAWATVAANDRSPDQWVMYRLMLTDMRDLTVLRARAEKEAARTD